MNETDQIRYLNHNEIDIVRWDQCIANSLNRLPYAASWYLDRMAGSWDALVMGDYLYVMPLPTGKKFGISYLLQPLFIQQLGVFSPFEVNSELLSQFLKRIPARFRLISLNLNSLNYPLPGLFTIRKNINFQLKLSPDYKTISERYSENTKRTLKKARQNGLQVFQLYNVPEFIKFTGKYLNEKTSVINDKHYKRLQLLVNYAVTGNCGKILGVYSASNTLCAAAFFLTAFNIHFYLVASSSREGIELKAMFFLVDHYIRNQSGKQEIFDFEGSNIEGIARFFAGFGAEPVPYYSVIRNRLPRVIKLFKKL